MDADTWQAIGTMIAALVATVALLVNLFMRINARLKKIENDLHDLRGLDRDVEEMCSKCNRHVVTFTKLEGKTENLEEVMKTLKEALKPLATIEHSVATLTDRYSDIANLLTVVRDHEKRIIKLESKLEAFSG